MNEENSEAPIVEQELKCVCCIKRRFIQANFGKM